DVELVLPYLADLAGEGRRESARVAGRSLGRLLARGQARRLHAELQLATHAARAGEPYAVPVAAVAARSGISGAAIADEVHLSAVELFITAPEYGLSVRSGNGGERPCGIVRADDEHRARDLTERVSVRVRAGRRASLRGRRGLGGRERAGDR